MNTRFTLKQLIDSPAVSIGSCHRFVRTWIHPDYVPGHPIESHYQRLFMPRHAARVLPMTEARSFLHANAKRVTSHLDADKAEQAVALHDMLCLKDENPPMPTVPMERIMQWSVREHFEKFIAHAGLRPDRYLDPWLNENTVGYRARCFESAKQSFFLLEELAVPSCPVLSIIEMKKHAATPALPPGNGWRTALQIVEHHPWMVSMLFRIGDDGELWAPEIARRWVKQADSSLELADDNERDERQWVRLISRSLPRSEG